MTESQTESQPPGNTGTVMARAEAASSLPLSDSERKQLRRETRRRRRALSPLQQNLASRKLCQRLQRHPWFRRGKRIAFYLAATHDGEIDPAPLLRQAWKAGKRCYLPVLRRDGPDRLVFIRYRPGDRLHRSRLGLREPTIKAHRTLRPQALSLVLMPLAAFDAACNRMGMGRGFYDRTFAFKRRRGCSRPLLMGLAHECQRVEQLPTAPWDVALDAVATPERVYYGSASPR